MEAYFDYWGKIQVNQNFRLLYQYFDLLIQTSKKIIVNWEKFYYVK